MNPDFPERQPSQHSTPGEWGPVLTWPDPTEALLKQFRALPMLEHPPFHPTKLDRSDYLKLIVSQVDFWKAHQNAEGAIIDPDRKVEWQYNTPAYALAATAAIAWDGREDLVESAAQAMDWSVVSLSKRRAPNGHEDFFPPLIAYALPRLEPFVPRERVGSWEKAIRGMDPNKIYRHAMRETNWNLVAASGEFLFQKLGLRNPACEYVNQSIATQGRHFKTPYGLYLEGPMAYDAFPRLWTSDLMAAGYQGAYAIELEEMLRRGALTSLFMQSPWGELPAGGRSAQHQWNEAQQCVIFEIFAARAHQEGDDFLAAIFKRGAHLALASMLRWVRPSGEMQIIKNWVDPARMHAYEGYSAHSNYNLLPMGMLAMAYLHAEPTEGLAEQPAPADCGGFVFAIEPLHKIIANVGGTYVEIDPAGDPHYDATGLIRVQIRGLSPQLGPNDCVVSEPRYQVDIADRVPANTAIGVAWLTPDGLWRRLGEMEGSTIKNWSLSHVSTAPERVSFDVTYESHLPNDPKIVENYVLTPGQVELTSHLENYHGPLRYIWPVLADDGRTLTAIQVKDDTVSVSQAGDRIAQTYRARDATSVTVEEARYGNHNGWARLAVAEYAQGGDVTLILKAVLVDD